MAVCYILSINCLVSLSCKFSNLFLQDWYYYAYFIDKKTGWVVKYYPSLHKLSVRDPGFEKRNPRTGSPLYQGPSAKCHMEIEDLTLALLLCVKGPEILWRSV